MFCMTYICNYVLYDLYLQLCLTNNYSNHEKDIFVGIVNDMHPFVHGCVL